MKAFFSTVSRRLRPSHPQLQILSDLHLEIGQQYASFTFPVSAPFLLLGGDIGRLIDYDGYLEFLEAQVLRYRKVFLVLGNHEFYGLDYDAGVEKARQLAEEPSIANGLVLLHRTRWDDDESHLTILGCTLWSAIPEDSYTIVESKVSDFKKIDNWTAQKHSQVHAQEVAWLRHQVAEINPNRQILIATHHAPCIEGTSRPEHTSSPWTCAFATDLLDQGGWDGVKVWVFGHTHYSTCFRREGIDVVANQRGYVIPGSKAQSEEGKMKRKPHEFDATMAVGIGL